jgi:transcription antitermination factor NusA-like protein
VAVPRALVGRLIGKSGENVKALKGKSGCHINFQQQNLKEVKTADGQEARVCTMTGPSGAIALGVRLLWEQILKFETIA